MPWKAFEHPAPLRRQAAAEWAAWPQSRANGTRAAQPQPGGEALPAASGEEADHPGYGGEQATPAMPHRRRGPIPKGSIGKPGYCGRRHAQMQLEQSRERKRHRRRHGRQEKPVRAVRHNTVRPGAAASGARGHVGGGRPHLQRSARTRRPSTSDGGGHGGSSSCGGALRGPEEPASAAESKSTAEGRAQQWQCHVGILAANIVRWATQLCGISPRVGRAPTWHDSGGAHSRCTARWSRTPGAAESAPRQQQRLSSAAAWKGAPPRRRATVPSTAQPSEALAAGGTTQQMGAAALGKATGERACSSAVA